MAIRKYPAGDQDRDTRVAPKRDGHVSMGSYGTIVYTYKLTLERPMFAGRLYHPVETYDDAVKWLAYYKSATQIKGFVNAPLYVQAWFVPRGET